MIHFSCPCGMKFKVKDEFAGRTSKCPTCKQSLIVPPASATVPFVPPEEIDGEESSLARAGVDVGVTLALRDAQRAGKRSVGEALASRKKASDRYVIDGEIARGGMGAVLKAIDCDIRREVAVKYMLDEKDPRKKARFIEEAQINGQLEHPNIVPVYDLGIDAKGRPFIMMKMVKGHSLKDVLDHLRDHPRQAEREYSLGRLLNILVNVCNALAFAHSRGVVHRDLKPANIMLGDFGEVYVMDWGLAKVLREEGKSPGLAAASTLPAAIQGDKSVSTSRSSKVETSREPEADLTQEGSIIGTPIYMPPEQAKGDIDKIDQRSDIYGLGAILYEMLTLQSPVEKEGGYLAILMRVCEGQIKPPEVRVPQRAGWIPRELSAIAMKALAKEPANRYADVEALRRDIERFQEGRSVSAKEDTFREASWKLVKRNKVASAFTAALMVVLVWSWWSNFQERRATDRARTETDQAYKAYQAQVRDSVPVLAQAAHLLAKDRKFADALVQVNLLLAHDHDHAEARLLKGQLLIVRREFAAAGAELERYLRLKPQDVDARRLADLCRRAKLDDPSTTADFGNILVRQRVYSLAESMFQTREQLLVFYRQRIEEKRKGWGAQLTLDREGKLLFRPPVGQLGTLADLWPLQDVPLNSLDLYLCGRLSSLTALHGMPLTWLNLHACANLSDLTPLRGMPLTSLKLHDCRQITDLSPLRGMPLASLDLSYCTQVTDISSLHQMPLRTLILTGCPVSDLAPLKDMPLKSIALGPADPGPLRSIKTLETIDGKPAAEFWKEYDAKKKATK